MVDQFQKPSNPTCDHAGFAIRKRTVVLKIKLQQAETSNLVLNLQRNPIIFKTVPGNTDALSKIHMSLKFPSPPFTHILSTY